MQGKTIGKIQSSLVRTYEVKIVSIVCVVRQTLTKYQPPGINQILKINLILFRVCLHTPKKKLLQGEETGGKTCVLHKWYREMRLMREEVLFKLFVIDA